MLLNASFARAGQITMVTYYPSPTGNYNLITASNIGIGTMSPGEGKLEVKSFATTKVRSDNYPQAFAAGVGGAPINVSIYAKNTADDGIPNWYAETGVAGVSINGTGVYGEGKIGVGGRGSILAGRFEGKVSIADYSLSKGRLGIGTENPLVRLHILGSGNDAAVGVENTSGMQGSLSANSSTNQFILGTISNHPVSFWTNNAEKMRIEPNGYVAIGASNALYSTFLSQWSPGNHLFVGGSMAIAGTGAPISGDASLVVSNGHGYQPGGGSWRDASDIRLKQNIRTLEGSLKKLLRLRGVQFEWKESEKHGNQTGLQMGMIAQEVEKVFPQWVGAGRDGYKTLGFSGFEALTVESFRELQAQVETLKAANENLLRRNDDLLRRVDALEKARHSQP